MVNRKVKITKDTKPTSTLKDLNLLEIKTQYKNKEIDFLHFKEQDLERIGKQIRIDIELLKKFKLMDYSLLFVVERYNQPQPIIKNTQHRTSNAIQNKDSPKEGELQFGESEKPDEEKREFFFSHMENVSLETNRHKYISSCGNYIYHLAIIDYLQSFN
mmetsp:Transcript_41115/g.62483  ORF Transcript_41115/g.62483 Transcript_41115/m.62483 type:complete len:159 (+) Transcript_41115:395-871(+)